MQPLTGLYVNGVNRRSPFVIFTFCVRKVYQKQIPYKREIRVVFGCVFNFFGCVFNFMMCSKVIYTGLIKSEIGNCNSDGYFHRACAIGEQSWWKVSEKSG